jgi:hypothetical protein
VSTDPTGVGVDHADAPPVGFVEVSTYPKWSTATHSDGDAHDTSVSSSGSPYSAFSSISTGADHADAPPVGSVDVSTFPSLSTATHNADTGHEMLWMAFVPSTFTVDHDNGVSAAAGAANISTDPQTTARQADTPNQRTPLSAVSHPP